jgi:SET domain-containing protein
MPTAKPSRPYVVRRSKIHGRGVFATRTIRKGTTVIEYRGDRTTWDTALARPQSDPADPHHTFFFETSDGMVIDANVRGNAARWINHSCDANCESCEDDDGRVFIEARRTIRAGDEITYDYRLSLDGRLSKRTLAAYACHCGTAKCRGVLLILPKKKRAAAANGKAARPRKR